MDHLLRPSLVTPRTDQVPGKLRAPSTSGKAKGDLLLYLGEAWENGRGKATEDDRGRRGGGASLL